MRLLTFILLFNSLISLGVNTKPNLLRGCVNYDDSTITISWSAIEDNCGSFKEAKLYANENNGTFILIATITQLSITSFPHYIPNLNTARKYYLTVLTTCNGIDSLTSDTITPDLTYPVNIELDSVSYDFATQNIIAGWKPNPSADTKGYQVYNYSSGNGDSIGFTSNTSFTVSNNPAIIFPVVMATLDSCNLSSTLSNPHRVSVLSGSIDTCDNSISLSWTKYQGWSTIDSICLFIEKNGNTYVKTNTFSGATTSFVYRNFNLGDTMDMYVRAYTNGGISSSTNRLKFETRKLFAPYLSYLSNVSVVNNESIAISCYIDEHRDQKEILVYRFNHLNIPILLKTISTRDVKNYSLNDYDVAVNERSYTYLTKVVNKCSDTIIQSNPSRSIHLKIDPDFIFNHYINWDGGVEKYSLEYSSDGSTWNEIKSTTDSFVILDLVEPGCYIIKAHERLNSLLLNEISRSNQVCKIDSMEIYIPTAINLNTQNNTFVVAGKGIDHTKSNYQIYNRWGEMLADNPTSSTWNGVYKNEPIPGGVYVYIVNAYGLKGEKQVYKGTLYVIR